jgi:hypothetical protein
VFVFVGENTTHSHLDTTNAPYLMGHLRPRAAWLTKHRATTHWSQANHVALTSGRFTRCEQQDYDAACHDDADDLFHQLDVTGRTWTTWLEGGTAKCDRLREHLPTPGSVPAHRLLHDRQSRDQLREHRGEGGVWSATNRSQECLQNDIYAGPEDAPRGDFDHALASGDVPAFNLVLPDGCEVGEGNCKPTNNRYRQFDDFPAREVPKTQRRLPSAPTASS